MELSSLPFLYFGSNDLLARPTATTYPPARPEIKNNGRPPAAHAEASSRQPSSGRRRRRRRMTCGPYAATSDGSVLDSV